ncbi:MAG: response regulator [Patescibacteria group bacterium]|nr:response regulator [Patescibacteria group bacterium]
MDDDDQALRSTVEALNRRGYCAIGAKNGQDALGQVQDLGRNFRNVEVALAITDIYMPDMDGLELIMALRHNHPEIQVISMTGADGVTDLSHVAEQLGAAASFHKSEGPSALLALVENLIGNPASLSSTTPAAYESS